jgi:zinc-binding alcohol dehydrogenase family protein
MRAVGYFDPLGIDDPSSLQDIVLPDPKPGDDDLLVRVHAVSVNPADTKVRRTIAPPPGQAMVLGWDAVGVVERVGAAVTQFGTGDRVYYAGDISRPGTNSELHVVDGRIAARAPTGLDDAAAAALPLTTITAYEVLFDRLRLTPGGGAGQSILIIGGAGGVGSIMIQLARQLTELHVIATASRDETREWCLALGAHAVIDHSKPLMAELDRAGIGTVEIVASLTQTSSHYPQIVEILKPQGQLSIIDDPPVLDAAPLKSRSISLHWESMFTRPRFRTLDVARQGELLAHVASLVDHGTIRSTATSHFGTINAHNLRRAHALVESGTLRGKVVLEGFEGPS